jgi:signal transduction histidine kinase
MTAMPERSRRLRSLVQAGIALSSELSLEAVLQQIAESAAEITGAKYAALGVIDRYGSGLERFVTTGLTPEQHHAIGDLPRGRGILGALIHDSRNLRLDDLTSDPRSAGFPPNHPPMTNFLGVPIKLRGVAYGNLYLTEKDGGFTDEDEDLVSLLAAQAAVSVENARLYESATRWSRQLESLNEIGNALLGELELSRLLQLISERLRELLDARLVMIMLPSGDDLMVEAAAGEVAESVRGTSFPRAQSKAGRVLERRHSERVDELIDDPEVHQDSTRRYGVRTALFVPLVVRDRAIGVVVAHDKLGPDPRFRDDELRLAEQFAQRAAVAFDLSERVARDALRRVVSGQELERRRLARELHDETGQALTSILLGLKSVEDAKDPDSLRTAAANLRELVVATLQDVRRLAIELRPKALDDFGLQPALERLVQTYAERTGLDVQFESQLGDERMSDVIETTLYRIVQEALTNIVKHAHARTVSVLIVRRRGVVTALIEDDGRGFDASELGDDRLGLVGMRERVGLIGGRLTIESSEGGGTTLAVEVPAQ